MTTRISTLPNGFRVATERMPGLRSAALGLYLSVGARHERAEQNGVAHFLEHMAFKGTSKRSAFQISESIEEVGGSLNAYTGREVTAYIARVLEKDVPLAIELIADIALNSVFDPGELELERNVILHEIGEIEDIPEEVVFEALQSTAYPTQSFGRSIIGTAELVSGFKRADLVRFVQDHYRPGRMVLAAAGSVEHEAVLEFAGLYFGELDSASRPEVESSCFESGEFRREKDMELAQYALAFEAPKLRDELSYASRVYAGALGGGAASRLFTEAREKRGLCYSISAQATPHSDTGMFVVHASTSEDNLGDLARLCIDEIRRSAEDLEEKEVERARAQIRAGSLMALESPVFRAERLGNSLSILGEVEEIDKIIAKFDAVDAEKARSYARGLVEGAKSASAFYGPISAAPTGAELVERLAA